MPGLAAFIRVRRADLGGVRPVAVGFSNGAIATAALLMSRADLLGGAVLFRPLSPFVAPPFANLDGVPVLVLDGADDERRSPGEGRRCAQDLTAMGADVTHHVLPAGHALTDGDEHLAAEWLHWKSSSRPAAVSQ